MLFHNREPCQTSAFIMAKVYELGFKLFQNRSYIQIPDLRDICRLRTLIPPLTIICRERSKDIKMNMKKKCSISLLTRTFLKIRQLSCSISLS